MKGKLKRIISGQNIFKVEENNWYNMTKTNCSDCGLVIDFETSFSNDDMTLCSDCHADSIITHNEYTKKTK